MAGRSRAAVLWTPCGVTVSAAVALWFLGQRTVPVLLLTALTGGVVGVALERLSKGRHDLRWLVQHAVIPAVAAAIAVAADGHDEAWAGQGQGQGQGERRWTIG